MFPAAKRPRSPRIRHAQGFRQDGPRVGTPLLTSSPCGDQTPWRGTSLGTRVWATHSDQTTTPSHASADSFSPPGEPKGTHDPQGPHLGDTPPTAALLSNQGADPGAQANRDSWPAPGGPAGVSLQRRHCSCRGGVPKVRETRPCGDCPRGTKGLSHPHREVHTSAGDPRDQILCHTTPTRAQTRTHVCHTNSSHTRCTHTHACTRHK